MCDENLSSSHYEQRKLYIHSISSGVGVDTSFCVGKVLSETFSLMFIMIK